MISKPDELSLSIALPSMVKKPTLKAPPKLRIIVSAASCSSLRPTTVPLFGSTSKTLTDFAEEVVLIATRKLPDSETTPNPSKDPARERLPQSPAGLMLRVPVAPRLPNGEKSAVAVISKVRVSPLNWNKAVPSKGSRLNSSISPVSFSRRYGPAAKFTVLAPIVVMADPVVLISNRKVPERLKNDDPPTPSVTVNLAAIPLGPISRAPAAVKPIISVPATCKPRSASADMTIPLLPTSR